MSIHAWLLRRRVRRWESARLWAEAMNDRINQLPQHQQDQIDALLRHKVGGK